MSKKIYLTLPQRTEKRYVILSPEKFLDRLSSIAARVILSDDEYVQSIYINNEDHFHPFFYSTKLRRFLPQPSNLPRLDDGTYFLDEKRVVAGHVEKERYEDRLSAILRASNICFSHSDIPKRLYIAVEHLRHHYVPHNARNGSITIDTDMNYFFFPPGSKESIAIGSENFTRVEIKMAPNQQDLQLEALLEESGAVPITSKKFKGYYFVGAFLAKTYGGSFHKELIDIEIEAKLETADEDIFPVLKNLFRESQNGFVIPSNYPFSHEKGVINRYYKSGDTYFKALLIGDKAAIIRKSGDEIVENSHGLDCIIKRNETKGEIVPMTSTVLTDATVSGEFARMRKAFWVENDNGRIYHITFDNCVSETEIMNQLEVEYTGKYGEPTGEVIEQEIIDDIATITQVILDNFPTVRQSSLTKAAWITNQ